MVNRHAYAGAGWHGVEMRTGGRAGVWVNGIRLLIHIRATHLTRPKSTHEDCSWRLCCLNLKYSQITSYVVVSWRQNVRRSFLLPHSHFHLRYRSLRHPYRYCPCLTLHPFHHPGSRCQGQTYHRRRHVNFGEFDSIVLCARQVLPYSHVLDLDHCEAMSERSKARCSDLRPTQYCERLRFLTSRAHLRELPLLLQGQLFCVVVLVRGDG